jgi:type I restriction enzyme M protein
MAASTNTVRDPSRVPSVNGNEANVVDAFRHLYYHLYSNGRASRAERIIADLSMLLLFQLLRERNDEARAIAESFIAGRRTANTTVLPLLRQHYRGSVAATDRFSIGDEALRAALEDLSDICLSDAPAHVVGDAFQAVMGPRLRGEKGQFFTPRTLVRGMVEVVAPRASETLLDPACGTGGFLAEAFAYQMERWGKHSQLTGVDKDQDLARLAAALLQVMTDGRARVLCRNSLDPVDWNSARLPTTYDIVLTNPPFGSRIGITDPSILGSFDFGHVWDVDSADCTRTDRVAAAQDPQVLFLERCVQLLKPGGRLGIVLPEGMFGNKRTRFIWDWLAARGEILGLLDCPRTTFQPGTDTKTNVLFFRRADSDSSRGAFPITTQVAVALKCGHDRRGRTHTADGSHHADDFVRLGRAIHESQGEWRRVTIQSDRYLVPRYFVDDHTISDADARVTEGAEWATIGELCSEGTLAVRKGHEPGADAYGTGDIPFVRTSDIANFEIRIDPTTSVSDEVYEQYRPQQDLRSGDILMVVDGRYRIGTTAILTPNNCHCVVQSHIRIISTRNRNQVEPYGLLFALNLPSIRYRLRNLVFVQSTLGTLGRRLFDLAVPLLRGEGPWSLPIESFRRDLIERDRLLWQLRNQRLEEFEL